MFIIRYSYWSQLCHKSSFILRFIYRADLNNCLFDFLILLQWKFYWLVFLCIDIINSVDPQEFNCIEPFISLYVILAGEVKFTCTHFSFIFVTPLTCENAKRRCIFDSFRFVYIVHMDRTELVTQQILVFVMIPLEVGFTNRYYSFTSFFV